MEQILVIPIVSPTCNVAVPLFHIWVVLYGWSNRVSYDSINYFLILLDIWLVSHNLSLFFIDGIFLYLCLFEFMHKFTILYVFHTENHVSENHHFPRDIFLSSLLHRVDHKGWYHGHAFSKANFIYIVLL